MPGTFARWTAMMLLSLGLLLPQLASAQTDEELERAKTLYTNGSQLYEEGSYAAAAKAFLESYRLSNEPALLYNVANSYERLGDLDNTIKYLDEYRIYASEEEAEALERRLAALERRRTEEERERFEAEKAASEAEARVAEASSSSTSSSGGTTLTLDRPDPGPWIMLGVGGAAAAALGVVSGVTYSQGQDRVASDDQSGYDSLKPANNASVIGASIAGGIAVTGLIVGLVQRGQSARMQKKVSVSGFVSPQAAALTLRW